MRTFEDGDQWCAVEDDFVNLQESPAGFGTTELAARQALNAELSKREQARLIKAGGMACHKTLLDYFAAKAMQGLLMSSVCHQDIVTQALSEKTKTSDVLAEHSYCIAESMLTERNRISGAEAGAES